MRVFHRAAAGAVVLLLFAGAASAQACLGMPTRDGQIAFGGLAGDLDDDTHYGVEFAADVTGPAAFGVSYAGLGADGDRQVITGRFSYDFYLLEPEICFTAGALFDNAPAPGVDERLGIPIGIGIGKTLRSDRLTATVFAVPQYVLLRETIADQTSTHHEFMAEAGVTLGFRPLYVGGSFLVDTFGGSDPGLRIRAGLIF